MVRTNQFWSRLFLGLGAAWMVILPGATDQAFAQHGTLIPEGTPPAATTPYEGTKRAGAALNYGLELAEKRAIEATYNRWRAEPLHEAEIRAAMPAQGGVLIVLNIAVQKNRGEGVHRWKRFVSAYVGESGADEKEAREKHAQQELRGPSFKQDVPGSVSPAGEEISNDYRWVPASPPGSGIPDPKLPRESILRLDERLLH